MKEKNSKKGSFIVIALLCLAVFISLPFVVNYKKSYANEKDTATFKANRTLLQKYVTSTAKQYLYKNTYTDYEQHAMDDKKTDIGNSTFMFRTFTSKPEELSRTNNVNVDCSSFATSVYMNALGYSFNDYYNYTASNNYYFNSSNKYLRQKNNKNYLRYGMLYTGKGPSTYMFEKIVESKFSNRISGKIYKGSATNSLVPFYYKLTGKETQTKINEVYKNFGTTIQNGDLFVIRYANDEDEKAGHIMVYTNDLINEYGQNVTGFIHSTGIDYDFTNSAIGDDQYSVRFMPYSDFRKFSNANLGYLFAKRTTGKRPISIMILRPINEVLNKKYTNFYNNTYGSLITSKSTIARNEMVDLKIEEYASVKIGDTYKNISKYNSVNSKEEVKYNLKVTNKSLVKNYTITVSDTLPANATYVSCSNNCTYNKDSRKVTWNDIVLSSEITKDLSYSIIVNQTNGSTLTNSGMKIITAQSNILTMPDIKIDVNKTNRKDERIAIMLNVDKIKGLTSKGYLKVDSKGSIANYKTKVSTLNSAKKTTITRSSALKLLYYNALGIDLKTLSSYKSAAFTTINSGYSRKTEKTIDSNNINKMIIPGLYGGRKVRGNITRNRVTQINVEDLEIGDIIIPGSISNAYMFLGKNDETNSYEFINNDLKIYTGIYAKNLLRKVFAYDTFVIIRPSRVYDVNISKEDTIPSCQLSDSKTTTDKVYAENTWANQNVSMTFKCNSQNTIKKIESYVVDQNLLTGEKTTSKIETNNVYVLNYTSFNKTFSVDDNKAHKYTWYYKATDKNGKTNTKSFATVLIDKTAPKMKAFTICKRSDGRRKIVLNCEDSESGIDKSKSYIKFTDYNDKSPSMVRATTSKHTYTAICVDKAGNRSNIKTGTFLALQKSDKKC